MGTAGLNIKRAFAYVVGFVASLALILCSAYLAVDGDTSSYIAATGCGVLLFALVIMMVAVAEEREQ